jgi:hypothetical protein
MQPVSCCAVGRTSAGGMLSISVAEADSATACPGPCFLQQAAWQAAPSEKAEWFSTAFHSDTAAESVGPWGSSSGA